MAYGEYFKDQAGSDGAEGYSYWIGLSAGKMLTDMNITLQQVMVDLLACLHLAISNKSYVPAINTQQQ